MSTHQATPAASSSPPAVTFAQVLVAVETASDLTPGGRSNSAQPSSAAAAWPANRGWALFWECNQLRRDWKSSPRPSSASPIPAPWRPSNRTCDAPCVWPA